MFQLHSSTWHWAYILLTVVLNILVLVAWKDPTDVTPENRGQITPYVLKFLRYETFAVFTVQSTIHE